MRIGAEYRNACFTQNIGNAFYERRFRADDHQFNIVLTHEIEHRVTVFDVERFDIGAQFSGAAIAWRDIDLAATRAFRQRPGDRLLSAATA